MSIELNEYFDTTTCDVYTFNSADFSVIDNQLEAGQHYNTQTIQGITYVIIDKSITIESPALTKL